MRVLLPIVLLAAAIALLAYLFRGDDEAMPATPEPVATAPAPPAAITPPEPVDPKVEREAKAFVEKLTASESDPVAVESADHFVKPGQALSLIGQQKVEQTTSKSLLAEPGVSASTPVTVVKKVEQIETTTPERIIAASGGDLDKPIKVLEGVEVKSRTVREVLERHAENPEAPITVVRDVEYYERTTAGELGQDPNLSPDEPIRVIRGSYATEQATVEELMGASGMAPAEEGTVYYVRTVQPTDDQGIWGIVHHGLIENFARGMAVRRGEQVDTYRIDIPSEADEPQSDRSSSFLGRLIHSKTIDSAVYNFKEGRMGHNPDLVLPGQELVIIQFSPEELTRIYQHFLNAPRG